MPQQSSVRAIKFQMLSGIVLVLAFSFLLGRTALRLLSRPEAWDAPRSMQAKSRVTATGPARFDDLARASRIPHQQEYSRGPDPGPPPQFVEMGDPRSVECIVRDVSQTIEGGSFRWTYAEPTLKFYVEDYDKQRFSMDFALVDATFKDTGPVTLSCYVNGHKLITLRCPKPGDYHLEKAVSSSWLKEARPTVVRAVLDKVWVAPADGARMGYVLLRAGFHR